MRLTGLGLAGDQRSPVGRGLTPGPVRLFPFFWNFIFYFIFIFGSLKNGLGVLGEWVYNTPIL
jgi:hypothetical protein